jgi:hypothetical protein
MQVLFVEILVFLKVTFVFNLLRFIYFIFKINLDFFFLAGMVISSASAGVSWKKPQGPPAGPANSQFEDSDWPSLGGGKSLISLTRLEPAVC